MHDLVLNVADWLSGQPPAAILGILFVVAIVENIVPVIPGDTFIVLAGSIAAFGIVGFVPIFLIATVGGVVGFIVMYELGRRVGTLVDNPRRLPWVSRPAVARARTWLRRRGYGVVAANRFLSGARSVVALAAGISRLDRTRTIVWASVSAIVWTLLLVTAGYQLGANWTEVLGWLKLHGRVVFVGIVVLVVVYVILRWRRKAS